MISGRSRLTRRSGDAEAEPRDDLLGDGGAAEHVPPLEDERLEAGAREVRGADESPLCPPPMTTAS